mmetsp:Transcript_6774/g.19704  ORF Transcript_6774/g.19704 Transcript_6774/m.19704 type:complete len:369 (-) Transcript_6774:161-1267(-)
MGTQSSVHRSHGGNGQLIEHSCVLVQHQLPPFAEFLCDCGDVAACWQAIDGCSRSQQDADGHLRAPDRHLAHRTAPRRSSPMVEVFGRSIQGRLLPQPSVDLVSRQLATQESSHAVGPKRRRHLQRRAARWEARVDLRHVRPIRRQQPHVAVDEGLGEDGKRPGCRMDQVPAELVLLGRECGILLNEALVEQQQLSLHVRGRRPILIDRPRHSQQLHHHRPAQVHVTLHQDAHCGLIARHDGHPDRPALVREGNAVLGAAIAGGEETRRVDVGPAINEGIHDGVLQLRRGPPRNGDGMSFRPLAPRRTVRSCLSCRRSIERAADRRCHSQAPAEIHQRPAFSQPNAGMKGRAATVERSGRLGALVSAG